MKDNYNDNLRTLLILQADLDYTLLNGTFKPFLEVENYLGRKSEKPGGVIKS